MTRAYILANSADPDEMAYNEPSHLDLHCLPVCVCVFVCVFYLFVYLFVYLFLTMIPI